MTRHAVLPVALAGILAGCMMIDSISPQVRLSDQVHQLNDEVRWGRVDLAAQRVSASHRPAFIAQHRAWGSDVRVADADVTNMDMDLGDGRCASYVAYSWIDERSMTLRTTTVRQIWRGEGEGFVLIGEEILGGDESLLPGAPLASAAGDAVGEDGSITSGGEGEADGETAGGEQQPGAARTQRRDAQGTLID